MGKLRVAVHQPNYLPWLGFFHKISQVDTFVLLDTVQFARRGYTHRVRVMGPSNSAMWLTQHIRKQPVQEQIIDQLIFSDRHWVDKHLKTFNAVYRKAPYFLPVFALLEKALALETDSLADCNSRLISEICKALGLSTNIVRASSLRLEEFSCPSERIACLVHHLGGDRYLSGAGAKAYNDHAVFARYDIQLSYDQFAIDAYPQRSVEFIGGLSIVDALFNIGFDGVSTLLAANHQPSDAMQAMLCP